MAMLDKCKMKDGYSGTWDCTLPCAMLVVRTDYFKCNFSLSEGLQGYKAKPLTATASTFAADRQHERTTITKHLWNDAEIKEANFIAAATL
eukprot:295356-Pelagomonas_calceolata.AAC.2